MTQMGRMTKAMFGGGAMLLGFLFAFTSFVSCDSEGTPPSPELTTLLARAGAAPFSGEREYENFYGPVAHRVSEWVASDGKGTIAASLRRVDGLGAEVFVQAHGEAAWKTAQAKFGLMAWYATSLRDFQVRDAGLFAQNYRVLATPQTGAWLGRETIELVLGAAQSATRYEISVDKDCGLALRIEEKSREGRTLSRLQYRSILFGAQAEELAKASPLKRPAELSLGTQPAWGEETKKLGFAPFVPSQLPQGFRRMEAKLLSALDGTHSLLDLFTDGVEVLAVRERVQPFSVVFSQEELEALKAQESSPARRFVHGPLTVIESYVGDLLISVIGKLSPSQALAFVESFTPAH